MFSFGPYFFPPARKTKKKVTASKAMIGLLNRSRSGFGEG